MTTREGLCQCGCGGVAPLATVNHARRGLVKGQPRAFIHGHNRRVKERRLIAKGYVLVHIPEHPRADRNGYVPEHVLIAERALGKSLPSGAVVHHVNELRCDNRNSNLAILPGHEYHGALHGRLRVQKAGGHPFKDQICFRCNLVKPKTEFGPPKAGRDRNSRWCRTCSADYKRQRKNRPEAA